VHTGLVGRLYVAQHLAALTLDEIAHQLSGSNVVATAQLVSARLPEALKSHAVERTDGAFRLAVLAIVLRRDAHHDASVGIALVARILAHAVGDHAVGLGRGGDHGAARAHAEAVHRAPIAGMVHQLVVGRAQDGVAGVRAKAGLVD